MTLTRARMSSVNASTSLIPTIMSVMDARVKLVHSFTEVMTSRTSLSIDLTRLTMMPHRLIKTSTSIRRRA